MANHNLKLKNGFTLLETLVAISILVLVLAGFFSLVVISLRSFEVSKQKYLAAKIAQEGIELLVNKRDNNVFCIEGGGSCAISDWRENLIEGGIGSWEVDATKTNQLIALPAQKFKIYDPSRFICIVEVGPYIGMFGYCPVKYLSGNFTREVEVTGLSNEKILVKSIVRWQDRGIPKELILEEVLFGLP